MKPSSFDTSARFCASLPCLIAVVLFLPSLGLAATLRVPQDYPSVTAAAVVAQSGDVIEAYAAHDYMNDNATIRSGVTVLGVRSFNDLQPYFSSSTFTLLDGPDSTRIDNLLFGAQNFENQIVSFISRLIITRCSFQAPAPFFSSSLELWEGGSVRFSEFSAITTESTSIKLRQGRLDVSYCVFHNPTYAVAVLNQDQGLANVVIKNNTMAQSNLHLRTQTGSQVAVINNIFWDAGITSCVGNGHVTVNYNDFFEGPTACPLGSGNISLDPLFCPFPQLFRLNANSPCLGTGENGSNMGALGIGCGATSVDAGELALQPVVTLSVEPNPVASVATFRAEGARQDQLMEIYSADGRLKDVLKVVTGKAQWRAGPELPRGIYFARIAGDGAARPIKFVVIR